MHNGESRNSGCARRALDPRVRRDPGQNPRRRGSRVATRMGVRAQQGLHAHAPGPRRGQLRAHERPSFLAGRQARHLPKSQFSSQGWTPPRGRIRRPGKHGAGRSGGVFRWRLAGVGRSQIGFRNLALLPIPAVDRSIPIGAQE